MRSHGPVPRVDRRHYRLQVRGLVERPLGLSLPDLKGSFPTVRLEATLACAGNRRQEFSRIEPVFGEIPWGPEAISHARWAGVSLRAVLERAGVGSGARHVCFTGLDEAKKGPRTVPFGGSIPLRKALHGDVVLAFEMNGKPLTAGHGAPLRVVVPGYIGARSVKWLSTIELASAASGNPFQQQTYKRVPRAASTAQWARAPPLGPLAVNCAVCTPSAGARVVGPDVLVRGYALGGHGRALARVEVSGDGGRTWARARLEGPRSRWGWRLWQVRLPVKQGPFEVVARAFDAQGAGQPSSLARAWNAGGYVNNAWHRVAVTGVRGTHP